MKVDSAFLICDVVASISSDHGDSFREPVPVADDNRRINCCPESGPSAAIQQRWCLRSGMTEVNQDSAGVKLSWTDDGGKSFVPALLVSQTVLDLNPPLARSCEQLLPACRVSGTRRVEAGREEVYCTVRRRCRYGWFDVSANSDCIRAIVHFVSRRGMGWRRTCFSRMGRIGRSEETNRYRSGQADSTSLGIVESEEIDLKNLSRSRVRSRILVLGADKHWG